MRIRGMQLFARVAILLSSVTVVRSKEISDDPLSAVPQ